MVPDLDTLVVGYDETYSGGAERLTPRDQFHDPGGCSSLSSAPHDSPQRFDRITKAPFDSFKDGALPRLNDFSRSPLTTRRPRREARRDSFYFLQSAMERRALQKTSMRSDPGMGWAS